MTKGIILTSSKLLKHWGCVLQTKAKARKRAYQAYTIRNIGDLPQYANLSSEAKEVIQVTARVLPFRVNNYVCDELIDWSNIPADPIFQMTFPQKGMLAESDFHLLRGMMRGKASDRELANVANDIRYRMNPHPAGQLEHNVPMQAGVPVKGVQRKYRETALFFPSSGQTCHAYCTYCFRWAQFIGVQELRFAAQKTNRLTEYLLSQKDISDLLITGGDPLVMRAKVLRSYIEPILISELEHVRNIRIGTKSVAYWPQRFVSDPDADDLLRLFEQVVHSGRHVSVMAHYSHPRELGTPIARQAIQRLRATGCEIRMQAPLIRHVNDNYQSWVTLWNEGVNLGVIPYYMFVERDTGPRNYFEVPLARAYGLYRQAYQQVSGLARTVRGPSMSAEPGKVCIEGIAEMSGKKVFVLSFIQARKRDLVRRPFFAEYDAQATWLDQLKPAFAENSRVWSFITNPI
jgi:KamA family protein